MPACPFPSILASMGTAPTTQCRVTMMPSGFPRDFWDPALLDHCTGFLQAQGLTSPMVSLFAGCKIQIVDLSVLSLSCPTCNLEIMRLKSN